MKTDNDLSRRERQIMDIVHELGEVTAAIVQEKLPDPPSYSAVRAMLAKLEQKGHLRHRNVGPRYCYFATQNHEEASRFALKKMMKTFFAGSPVQTVNALLDLSSDELSPKELEELSKLIENAKQEGR